MIQRKIFYKIKENFMPIPFHCTKDYFKVKRYGLWILWLFPCTHSSCKSMIIF